MLIITKQDLDKMSIELRNELMQLMFEPAGSEFDEAITDGLSISLEEHRKNYDSAPQATNYDLSDKSKKTNKKTVIPINEIQAKELVANLSDKSIETLRVFTSDTPVKLDSLVGDGKPYASYNKLKRSFVGPVNRRLRTVTQNRTAVLFRKTGESEDDSEISVKEETISALKHIFQI